MDAASHVKTAATFKCQKRTTTQDGRLISGTTSSACSPSVEQGPGVISRLDSMRYPLPPLLKPLEEDFVPETASESWDGII